MFDIGYSELLVVAIVALIVIGPKDLPRVMRTVGQWMGRARGMARHFRSGIDTMIRESELEEMEQKWREENERIMREHPAAASWDDPPALAAPDAADGNAAPVDDAEPAGAPPAAGPGAADVMMPLDAPAPAPSASPPGPDDQGAQLSLLPPDGTGAGRRPLP
jgi:sec-independent protein translocase protein TatB